MFSFRVLTALGRQFLGVTVEAGGRLGGHAVRVSGQTYQSGVLLPPHVRYRYCDTYILLCRPRMLLSLCVYMCVVASKRIASTVKWAQECGATTLCHEFWEGVQGHLSACLLQLLRGKQSEPHGR